MADEDEETTTQPEGDTVTIEVPTQGVEQATKRQPRQREPKVFTEEDVERIRQEEKQKLYPRLEKVDTLEAQVAEMRQAESERKKAEDKARRDAEKAAKAKEEEEMELRDLLNRKDEEWGAKLDAERQEREKAVALFEKEREYAALQTYLSRRMVEEAESIMPQLHYTIGGNSQEEIEASIERAKQATAEIMGEVTSRMQNNRAGQRGASVSQPPVGPMEMQSTQQVLTADDLKALTPEDYAANREQLLREAGRAFRSR